MSNNATLIVEVSPEAAKYVAELGMLAEMQQMIDHACETIPGLWRLRVDLQPPYDLGGDDQVILYAFCSPMTPADAYEIYACDNRWKTSTFHADVFHHFTLLLTFGRQDER